MRKLLMATAALALIASPAFAHCDSMAGPVILDAQRALETQDVTGVLKWVTAQDAAATSHAIDMALPVRAHTTASPTCPDQPCLTTPPPWPRLSVFRLYPFPPPTPSPSPHSPPS